MSAFVEGETELLVALGEIGVKAQFRVAAVTRQFGALLKTKVMQNASTGHHAPGEPHIPGTGPGPNVATGDYLRTWSLEVTYGANTIEAKVGTNAPQGRRLEFGFVDVDSAGRHYNQQPYPHAGPAHDAIVPAYEAAVAEAVFGAL